MKKKLILTATLSAFAFAVTSAQAVTTAVTKPVGYHTISVVSNPSFQVFNVVGSNFSLKILAAGEMEAPSANTITDAEADFTTALAGVATNPDTGAPNLAVEITSGPNAGLNTEVTGSTMTTLSTLDDLTPALSAGDTYIVREMMTIAAIYGPNNEAGLHEGNSSTADKIWIPEGNSNWLKAYYTGSSPSFPDPANQWRLVGKNFNAADVPVYFSTGMIIERVAPPDLDIVVTGHVRTTSAMVTVDQGFTAMDRMFPVGATLLNSGLFTPNGGPPSANSLNWGDANAADTIWMPDGVGGWFKYFYSNGGFPQPVGWQRVGSSDSVALVEATPLTPGIIIERRAASTVTITVTPDPAIYGPL